MATINKPKVGIPFWGNPLNDTLDQINSLKADQTKLDEIIARLTALEESLYGLIIPQDIVYTFEEGTDGSGTPGTLAPGNGVLGVQGVLTYANAASKHGALGLRRTSGVHGNFWYANIGVASSSGSIYGRVTTEGSGNSTLIDFFMNDGTQGGSLVLKTGGAFQVIDPLDVPGESSTSEWVLDQWFRVDWQQTWDGTVQRLTFRIYVDDPEGTVYDALSVSWPSPLPDRIRFLQGNDSSAWGVDVDTFRMKNSVSAWYNAYDPAPLDAVVYGYDNGSEGAAVPDNTDGVIDVIGNPKFHAAAAPPEHGSFGIEVPAASGGGALNYPRVNAAAETGSVYLYILAAGGSDSKFVQFNNGTNRLAGIVLSSGRKIKIQDNAGSNKASGATTIPTNQWVRLDWQATFDSSNGDMNIETRLFLTAESSGSADGGIVSYFFTGGEAIGLTPNNIQVGSASNDWHYYYDTVRLTGNTDQWYGPFGTPVIPPLPALPGGVASVAWVGDRSQNDAYVTAYTASTVTSTGLDYSTSSTLASGVTNMPDSAATNGFKKFHMVGLSTNTKYYYQVTDTVAAVRTRIGPIRSFTTAKAVGTPTTLNFAVWSCKQDTISDPAVSNDIISWGVADFGIDLGDFGYPGNLTADTYPHMYNYALNIVDAARRTIQDVIPIIYIPSDHDSNGGKTKEGNAPNFNDTITAANIRACSLVVPIRFADTRSGSGIQQSGYPSAKYRSWVEGNVRFIMMDTRSLDRSDTVNVPTDPEAGKIGHDPSNPTTMLGSVQFNWVKSELDLAAANHQFVFLLSDPAWNGLSPRDGNGYIDATYSDKWPSYCYERDLISDYAFSKVGPNMIILFGDSHGLQFDDGTHEKNGYATFCCGPMHQNLHMHYQPSYQINYPAGVTDGGGPFRSGMQYQRVNVVESPAKTFTVTITGRDCTPFHSGGVPPRASGTPKTVNWLPVSSPTGPFVHTYTVV